MAKHDDYRAEADSDARDTAREFLDTIVDALCDDGEASDDLLNDYPGGDSYHHESHVDKSYSLMEAASLLDQLSDDEETDDGLWEGLPPREAVLAQAAYTYGNAVYSMFQDIIKSINGDSDIETLIEEYQAANDWDEDSDEPKPVRTADEVKAAIKAAVSTLIDES